MARGYGKDQPQGFYNRILRVAIIGAGGQVGKHIAEQLLKTGKHVVTAIARPSSTSTLPEGINIVRVDYSGDDDTALVEAFRGQQVLIITMSVAAPSGTISKLVRAAAKAGVPLGGGPDRYGFDFKKRSLILFDGGEVAINTSTSPQCGPAIANLLSLKELPDDETDGSPTLSQFRNGSIYISSFRVSQRDMFETLEESQAALQQGDMKAFPKMLYSRMFFPTGDGDYQSSLGLHNDLLGLPAEDLDEFTAIGVRIGENGELSQSH
ncbi:MAG: hypothetical protein Q9201_003582 [Fulgogasparrea decipioides]